MPRASCILLHTAVCPNGCAQLYSPSSPAMPALACYARAAWGLLPAAYLQEHQLFREQAVLEQGT